ncbi:MULTISPECIES: hypothetical protein [Photorhabdus]|uniref:Photorhabdus luminescens subsp. laumondii TTO1 complete genome segment 7/17 n=2 Tax=Photorhabdus TaxID=29487 RepID=Q7N5V8_PHOLL|nr:MULTISPECIES: hypothetical protein [Photorhabdus]CAE14115.1 unnamed protein product [Photorhabdus laumondii subsp. laumondii TTO1]RAW64176.1 hypothetical protein CKY15_23310 [Photorhabdus sp. S7-51]RAW65524.1 hypothetical protein CKY14_23170 [Photorhabdus sp. S14-60]RAW70612.1 hypothetical protein CKY06_23205 [Photorhabdus sp. S15-56]RAW86558.1 hypothetical protein CKY12_07120 [Photorhabdus sp. S12-55]
MNMNMNNTITETHVITVTNESTRLFIVKAFEGYELYINNMQEYMGSRFFKNIADMKYMDDVFDKVIENSKEGFSQFLKKNKSAGSLKEVFFDEVKVNLRFMHNVMLNSD